MHKNYLYLPYNLPYSWAKDITKLTCSSRFLNDSGEWWIHSILVLYWILWEIHTIIIFVKSVAFGKCFALLCWSSKEYKSLNSICFHLHSCKSKGESDVVLVALPKCLDDVMWAEESVRMNLTNRVSIRSWYAEFFVTDISNWTLAMEPGHLLSIIKKDFSNFL